MNRFSFTVKAIVCTLLLAAQSGCTSDDGPPMGRVIGEVTIEGKPIAEGVIHFSSIDGSTKTVSTYIIQGKFDERVPVGKNRVEISAVSIPPLAPGQNPETLVAKETVPAKYNLASELTAEIKKGTNDLKFALSKK